jgi:tetratricopeptide (TPR) repeat protein
MVAEMVGATGLAAQSEEPQAQEARPALAEWQKAEVRGDVMMARKQFTDAVTAYQDALASQPRNAVLLNKLGIAHHQLMRLDVAKKFYERATKADKTYAVAFNNLAALHYDLRRYRPAIKHFRKAIQIQPDLAAAHSGLGYAYFAQKKYDEALASFQRALELDPEIFERRSMFGSVVQSRAVAERSVFYFFLAKSFATQGNAERCAHYLRRARDEGYKGLASVATDPAFSRVIQDPLVQEVLNPPPSTALVNPPKPAL